MTAGADVRGMSPTHAAVLRLQRAMDELQRATKAFLKLGSVTDADRRVVGVGLMTWARFTSAVVRRVMHESEQRSDAN